MVGTGHPTWRKPACKRHSSLGNSLAVQGLGLCVSTAGARVPSLVREQRYCMPRSEAKKDITALFGMMIKRPRNGQW